MSGQKLVSRKAKHYLVRRPNEILWKKLSWNEVQAELREKGTGADEAMLFRVALAYEQATAWHTRRPKLEPEVSGAHRP